tara:strand:+ start:11859 stop:13160 length:1302 start_codon:yes stop_codon:yes gene_type:complete
MIRFMRKYISSFFQPNRISLQLLRVVFALYLTVTLIVTFFQFSAEYLLTKNTLLDELHQLAKTIEKSVTTSLWQLNTTQLNALADGLIEMPIVDGVDVFDDNDKPLIQHRTYSEDSKPLSLFFIDRHLSWSLSGQEIPLGHIRLYSSSNVILDRIIFGFMLIAINAVIKFIVLWTLFLWAFKHLLGRPLQRLMLQVGEIHLEHIGKKRINLGVGDNNELNTLQENINTMLTTIEHDRQLMLLAEEERHAWLEKEVALRTEELVNLNKKLSEIASTDDLTGIRNRRDFFERAQRLTDLALRQSSPLSLLALDIDYFKQINDRFGHSGGDIALCHFTKLISAQLRQVDLFARVGGEEFAILLPDTNRQGAQCLAEKLCKLIRETTLEFENTSFNMSVSIGVIEREEKETQVAQFFKRGDDLLYQAKNKGRNRVEV